MDITETVLRRKGDKRSRSRAAPDRDRLLNQARVCAGEERAAEGRLGAPLA